MPAFCTLQTLESLCNELIDSLPDHRVRGGRTVTVKMKFSTFDVITRCCSVDYMISDVDRLFALCSKFVRREMHNDHGSDKYLRLLGVRLAHLVFENEKIEPSNPLCSFWKQKETESTALGYISDDASNNSLLLSNLKFDRNFDIEDGLDGTSQEVVHLAEPQPCPICKVALPKKLTLVNQHIDECLNRKAISELQNDQNTINATVDGGSPEDKTPKKRLMKRKVSGWKISAEFGLTAEAKGCNSPAHSNSAVLSSKKGRNYEGMLEVVMEQSSTHGNDRYHR
ncbi:hypothetical protein LOAG_17402 [Loa loa]|uniref:DNA-directed DNA polymerase n=1 Tax=Loa loa TaxID=7209 RepID=A0A1S0UIU7_LOALO|nr:hypothetical protein LOAG_17402 [Loa loa]EJD75453.1 hypothetical protein LOAG_17402 [Loa loa]